MASAPTISPALTRLLGPITVLDRAGPEAPERLRMVVQHSHGEAGAALHQEVAEGPILMAFAHLLLGRCAGGDGPVAPGTLSLTCDFLGTAPIGAILEGTASATRRTRTVLFLSADVTLLEPEPALPILHATGLWRVSPS